MGSGCRRFERIGLMYRVCNIDSVRTKFNLPKGTSAQLLGANIRVYIAEHEKWSDTKAASHARAVTVFFYFAFAIAGALGWLASVHVLYIYSISSCLYFLAPHPLIFLLASQYFSLEY